MNMNTKDSPYFRPWNGRHQLYWSEIKIPQNQSTPLVTGKRTRLTVGGTHGVSSKSSPSPSSTMSFTVDIMGLMAKAAKGHKRDEHNEQRVVRNMYILVLVMYSSFPSDNVSYLQCSTFLSDFNRMPSNTAAGSRYLYMVSPLSLWTNRMLQCRIVRASQVTTKL